jgi:hypothetical protein
MKNKLNKFITGSVLAILLAGSLASAQTATTTPEVTTSNDPVVSTWDGGYNGYGMMGNSNWNMMRDGRGYSNERGAWKDMVPAFATGLIGLGIVFGTIRILLLAFWIWMLVHAASSDIKHKPLWLLVIWFMNIVGAIIYFFVIKRVYDREMKECGCEGCACDDMGNTCTCGKNETCQCEEELCVCKNGQCVCLEGGPCPCEGGDCDCHKEDKK